MRKVRWPRTWAPKATHRRWRPPTPDVSGAGAYSHEKNCILGVAVDLDGGAVVDGTDMEPPRTAALVAGSDLEL